MEDEPTYGSVVMIYGPTGTAYQRFYRDGLWHGTNGDLRTFAELRAMDPGHPLIVIHNAPDEP